MATDGKTDPAGPPKGETARLGDLALHYLSFGPASGEVLVFIHGSGPGAGGFSNFKRNISAFADQGYRVLVPDLPGFGHSSKPTDRDYTTKFFSDSLVGLLDLLQVGTCSLIGNSLGGAVAIRLALDHPLLVSKLVLMAPGGLEELETYLAMPAMAAMIDNFVEGGLDRKGLKRVLETLVYDPKQVTDELVDERWAVLQRQPPEVLSRMSIPNMTAELPRLRCPVLAFWGANDELVPPSGGAKLLASCRPCRLLELAACGHWVMLEHTRVFNSTCLDFLRHG